MYNHVPKANPWGSTRPRIPPIGDGYFYTYTYTGLAIFALIIGEFFSNFISEEAKQYYRTKYENYTKLQ